jgi:flagellar biogenesis protein FliO
MKHTAHWFAIGQLWCVLCVCVVLPQSIYAAESDSSSLRASLRPADSNVGPGVTQLALGFVITCAVAVGGIYGFKRWIPGWSAVTQTQSSIHPVETRQLSRAVRMHVVQVDESRFLIVEGRSSLNVITIPPASRSNNEAK